MDLNELTLGGGFTQLMQIDSKTPNCFHTQQMVLELLKLC